MRLSKPRWVRLIDNAQRHAGGVEVRLRARADGLVVEVCDRGPGLAAEALEKVYEPFFRGDVARARSTAGFGLGIPTAARLLRRFGGELQIVSRRGGGLRVVVTPPKAEIPFQYLGRGRDDKTTQSADFNAAMMESSR